MAGDNRRREFLGQIAGGAATLAGLSIASPLAAAEAAFSPSLKSDGEFNDDWTKKLDRKKLRTVFDAPEVNSALALHQANAVLDNYRDVAYMLAKKAGTKVEEVRAEMKANLIPGMTLLPTGIFAVVRAQNVGCSYMPAWYKLGEE